jgi:methyl-accepting chemotaxis protein
MPTKSSRKAPIKPALPRAVSRNGSINGSTHSSNGRGLAQAPATPKSKKVTTSPKGRTKSGPSELETLRARVEALDRSQAVIEFDLSGNILTANKNFLNVMGYSLEEIQGQHHQIFCESSVSQSPDYRSFWQALNRGELQSGEFKRVTKSGKEVWLIASYNPILGPDGRPSKIVNLATDITASKAELKVRTDVMNLTCIVSEADLKGDILSVNEKFIQVSKYGRDELIGKGHNTTRHPDMPKEVFREMWSTIGRGNIFRGVVKNRAKDGTPYYVDAVIAPILGENGKPKKYLGVRYDITEAELERQNMRGIFRAIDSVYAYIEFDTEGNLISANQNFQDTMEYSADALKGKHHRSFCDPAMVASAEYQQFWPDLRSGKSKSGEFKRVTRTGREVWLQAVYAPVMDEVGRVVKVVKIATDVTMTVRQRLSLGHILKEVAENAQTLSSASEELSANSQQMVSNAEETSAQAGVVSAAAQQVSNNVQTVASGTEEMSASIREIAKNAQEAAKVAAVGVTAADSATHTISKLGISSAEIGKVIKTITSIARQTNLLALNATIEAARAGEAGKGFAVVANEVKELAKETAKATEDISQKIESIQADTKHAVSAISEINGVIAKINDYQNTIASAVEEQTATTAEISRNVSEAARGSSEIAQNIGGVAQAAKNTTLGASDTEKAAMELARLAAGLQRTVATAQK